MKKAISPIISAVLLIAIVFGIAAIISPWMFSLTDEFSGNVANSTIKEIDCSSSAYDFDTSYGTYGVDWNFSGTSDSLMVKIRNTGTTVLYQFSFEVETNETSGLRMAHYNVNTTYQKTEALPLRPGESVILGANITENLNGTLKEVKILNSVCPSVYAKREL